MSVKSFVLQHENKENGILLKRIYEYELKNNSIYCGLFFCWQILLDGFIEEYLDLFPTSNQLTNN